MTNAKVWFHDEFHDKRESTVPWRTRKYIRGSMMTKSLNSTDVGETHDVSFEAPFTLRLAGYIDMLFFRCFVCNLWFLFVRVNVVSCGATLYPWGSQPFSDHVPLQHFYRENVPLKFFMTKYCNMTNHRYTVFNNKHI